MKLRKGEYYMVFLWAAAAVAIGFINAYWR
jgi:hypothetical protein